MERFIEILKRLLLAATWVCFGGVTTSLLFLAVTEKLHIGLLFIGGGSLVVAVSLTFIINWIFKAR